MGEGSSRQLPCPSVFLSHPRHRTCLSPISSSMSHILPSMFLLSYLTYIPWKWLFLPFYNTVHTPWALGRWKLLELFLEGEVGEREGVPEIRLGCFPYSCGVCPSRSLQILGTDTQGNKGFGSWKGCPGKSTRRG